MSSLPYGHNNLLFKNSRQIIVFNPKLIPSFAFKSPLSVPNFDKMLEFYDNFSKCAKGRRKGKNKEIKLIVKGLYLKNSVSNYYT